MLRWLGHSCFLIETAEEAWLTDPFAPAVGYPIPEVAPTVVSMSHDHYDHADESWLDPDLPVARGGAGWEGKDLKLSSVHSFHDTSSGKERGDNFIYLGKTDSCTIAHLGDLGHLLTEKQVRKIGKVDLLLLPVGGTYTIGPQEAWQVVLQLEPKVVIPMHYQTEHLTFPLAGLEEFLRLVPGSWTVEERTQLELGTLAQERIVVLKYS